MTRFYENLGRVRYQSMIEVPDSAFAPLTDRSKPLHCFDHEEYQYQVKVQAFSSTPPEITIQGISFERISLPIVIAYENGAEHCFRRSGGLRVPAEGGPSDEDMGALDVELKLAFESW